MKRVQTHLVNVETKTPIPQSKVNRTCHVEKQDNSWTLYIQHEFGGRKNHAIFAKAVNDIMDGCLNEIGGLSDMLSCDSPSQIPDVLNDHDVAIDYNEESEQFGQAVPNVYHYLMIQNPLCDFEEGDRVAYGEDEGGEEDWKEGEQVEESTKYTLAKILGRDNPIDRDAAKFDFNARYRIDFGSKTEFKIVSVLDIYSYNQDEMGNPVSDDNVETQVNIFTEKSNISRALTLAKKMESLSQRRKVLRRLFLHWFRCKDSDVAAEMTTFIESEVARLEILRVEETKVFTRWRGRGRRERNIFSGYDHWMSSGSHCRVHRFHEASEYVEPDTDEAERWIKQSKADLDATKMFLDKSYSHVCFLSQQCVEKVLKGVLYAKCGIPRRDLRTHNIGELASSVRRLEGAPSEVDRASKVANYYLPTRYPDNQPKYRVPAEEYSEEQAKESLEAAETVYTALEKFAHNNDD
jgi:HEPN domain-containing protein